MAVPPSPLAKAVSTEKKRAEQSARFFQTGIAIIS